MISVDAALRLGDFDLDIAFENDDGITALFGRSGSGKSTTINLIAGLARPDRGRIVLDGRTLVDVETGVYVPKYRRRVGLVFQDSQLFPHLSVRQNLLFGRWFAPSAERTIAFEPVVETLGIGASAGAQAGATVWRREAAGGARPGAACLAEDPLDGRTAGVARSGAEA